MKKIILILFIIVFLGGCEKIDSIHKLNDIGYELYETKNNDTVYRKNNYIQYNGSELLSEDYIYVDKPVYASIVTLTKSSKQWIYLFVEHDYQQEISYVYLVIQTEEETKDNKYFYSFINEELQIVYENLNIGEKVNLEGHISFAKYHRNKLHDELKKANININDLLQK